MQLWKQNFYFTFVIIHSVVLCSIFLFLNSNFRQQLKSEIKVFEQLVISSDILLSQSMDAKHLNSALEILSSSHKQFDFYLAFHEVGEQVTNELPEDLEFPLARLTGEIQLEKDKGKVVLYQRSVINFEGHNNEVVYARDLSRFYREFQQKKWLIYGLGLFVTAVIMAVTYWQMKRIYRPVQNLAHELRTPLTVISGYSEMLMRVKTTEEEKITMSIEILRESANLQEVVEQLLLMGDLKEGEVVLKKMLLSELIHDYRDKYPNLVVKIKNEKPFQGNRVLLLRLLDNLLENAYRVSEEVLVTISDKQLLMMNEGPTIAPSTLRKINKGRGLVGDEYSGTGQGLIICREIMHLHQGTMKLMSEEGCTVVKLSF